MGKTSISVPEMQRLLGMKKVEAYWLVKQGRFKVILVGGQLSLVGGLELSGILQNDGGILPRDHDDTVRVGQDDITGIDAHPAAGDGDVDLAGALLIGAAGGGAGAVHGEVPLADLVNVADRAVQHDTGDLLGVPQIGHHDLADQSPGVVFLVGHHQHVPLVAEVQGGVEGQVVPRSALDGVGGAGHHLGLGAAHQADAGVHGTATAHHVGGVGGGDGLKSLHQFRGGQLPLQIDPLSYAHVDFLLSVMFLFYF